ncbi:enterohemolysin EhxA [Escherichia coli]|nr:enterohemolysin EhxA [Escherichia coli]HAY0363262.1 enterohemolysin EhxA [Escherichia coli]
MKVNKIKNIFNNATLTTKSAFNTASSSVRSAGKKLILLIPDNYEAQGVGINELVKAADELGIEIHRTERDDTAIANQFFGAAEKVVGLTERGVAIFAPQLDKLLQKYQKVGSKIGGTAENVGNNLGKAGTVLSALQNFTGIALSGMALDELLRKQREGEDISQNDIAKSSIELINQLVDTVSSINSTVDSFSEQLNQLGSFLSSKPRLSSVGGKLQNLPDLGPLGDGLDVVSGILSAVSASFILGNSDAHTGTKAAAGIELTTQVLGNVGKAVSQYILAQRMAQGLSTTAASAGLITSAVMLAISPLSFLAAADKFERAKQLESYSERFKKLNYEGDALLAAFHKETGAIDAALTTINTVLSSVSAGVSAASSASLIGAPISMLVSALTGTISGILEASKQAMFEHVAEKFAARINEWEKEHGKNYFENGYDARHAAFLEDSLSLLADFSRQHAVERAVAITQQHWDEKIGELAGITRNADRSQSGKAYINYLENGGLLEAQPKEFTQQVFDPQKGTIDLSTGNVSSVLTFITPTFTPGEEVRERKQSGKYEYMTSLIVNGKDTWSVKGIKNHKGVYDYSKLIQFVEKNNKHYQARIISELGDKDDVVYSGAGSSEVFAGEGYDTVSYNKTDVGKLTIDATGASKPGEYIVSKNMYGDVKVLQEVVKEQEVSVGKRTEKIQYRDFEFRTGGIPYDVIDNLHSVEELIGGKHDDEFKGGKFNDIFHGADGNDYIEGNYGNDRLYGDDGDDYISGGQGDDQLFGGSGNDKLSGGDGNNYLTGGSGNDELQAHGAYNILSGGTGDDKLYGGGIDLLDGGEGNDYLNGGFGNDIYVYRQNYGHHTIADEGGKGDRLHLSDISFDDIAFKRVGNDLIMNKAINGVLSFNESNDVNGITFKNWFAKDASGADNHLVEVITDKDGREIKVDKIPHNNNERSGYIKASNIASEKNMVNITSVANDINKIISSVSGFDSGDERLASLYNLSLHQNNTHSTTLTTTV